MIQIHSLPYTEQTVKKLHIHKDTLNISFLTWMKENFFFKFE